MLLCVSGGPTRAALGASRTWLVLSGTDRLVVFWRARSKGGMMRTTGRHESPASCAGTRPAGPKNDFLNSFRGYSEDEVGGQHWTVHFYVERRPYGDERAAGTQCTSGESIRPTSAPSGESSRRDRAPYSIQINNFPTFNATQAPKPIGIELPHIPLVSRGAACEETLLVCVRGPRVGPWRLGE